MRALIVDDSRFVRGYVRGLLQQRGIECEEAGDGQAALDCLRMDHKFNLVLLDWNMPVMNGLDMLRHLRSAGVRGPKVLMVTAEAEHDYIRRAMDAGADEYLMKPFDRDALEQKLALLGMAEV